MFPARSMVVLACNPCPCGNYHPTQPRPCAASARSSGGATTAARLSGPDRRPDRHHPPRRAGAPSTSGADRLAQPESTADVRARVLGRAQPAGRPLPRHPLAAQRRRARPGAARAVAADRRGGASARLRDLLGPAHPTWRGEGAPAGLDGLRPAWRRPSRAGRARRRAAAPLRQTAGAAHPRAGGAARERHGRTGLARVGPVPARRAGRSPAHRAGRRAWARPWSTTGCSARPTSAAWPPTSPSDSRRWTRSATCAERPSGASGSWSPATRSGPPGWATSTAPSRWPAVGAPRWASGSAARCASRDGRAGGRGRRLAVGDVLRRRCGRRDRCDACQAGPHGGVRGGLRHRPVRPPRRSRDAWADGRGAGVRRRPRLPAAPTGSSSTTSPTTGLVVSELAPGCAPTKLRFLSRNRIIAALCGGTVVVEAAIRSGALNTASWALRLNRTLMGVPGSGHQRAVGGRAPADPRRATRCS